jgi:hypothetical protein
MNTDELLTTFRSEIAEPDRETSERIFAFAARSATGRRRDTFRLRPRLALEAPRAAQARGSLPPWPLC